MSYTDANGKRVRRTTETTRRKEAEALEAKWRVEAFRQKHWSEKPERTFDELMLEYVRVTENEKRASVRDRCSLKHLYPAFTGRDMNALTAVDVRNYIAKRKVEGAAASTINKEVGLLSSAINFAGREWGWELHNPASSCKQREPEGRVRWITREEADRLIIAASKDSRSSHLPDFIRLALNTGMRRGEMLGRDWARVDLRANLIHLGAEHTKSAKRRSIPLNAEAREAILRRARFRAEHCPGSMWVFCMRSGTRVGDVKRSFATACRRAGVADFRVHDLRHTCAAWLVSVGVPLTEVRDLLGHASITMTERYAHLAPENVRAAVALLDECPSRSGHARLNQGIFEFT